MPVKEIFGTHPSELDNKERTVEILAKTIYDPEFSEKNPQSKVDILGELSKIEDGDKLLNQALKLSGEQFAVEKNESQKNIIDNYLIPKVITTKTQGGSSRK